MEASRVGLDSAHRPAGAGWMVSFLRSHGLLKVLRTQKGASDLAWHGS